MNTNIDTETTVALELGRAHALVQAAKDAEELIEEWLFPRRRSQRHQTSVYLAEERFRAARQGLGEETTREIWKVATAKVFAGASERTHDYYRNDLDPRPDEVAEGGAE